MNLKPKIMLALAASLLSATALAEPLDLRRELAPDATVTVVNVTGEIDISTWDRNEVQLTGHTGENSKLEVNENEQGIRFEVRELKRKGRMGASVLTLVIPATANIIAESVNADIRVAGSRAGRITAESVSGDLVIEGETEWADLSSLSGDIEFRGSATRNAIETVSGDIDVAGVSGEVALSTVSGDAVLAATSLSHGKFETVSGTLELSLQVEDGGRLSVEAMSGDVTLALPANQTGEFRAQSFSGTIKTAFGTVERGGMGPGSHLNHVVGNSGAIIRVESFSGDIHI
ncbi:MAG TPA: DUF4097 family beta strand repeat-containing protein, partial [Xanthomonadales bacterium]|nr:DUF4097 family beta strand repeat-containing protein [Xanthomonadales bacterium]